MSLIQFSPIRSGSTLIYNYLIELGRKPKSKHHYNKNINNYFIITIRHPYNSIISSILRYDLDINIVSIKSHINEYLKYGGDCIINNDFSKDNHCILIYEKFLNNHDYIFNKLENFFNEKYSVELKNKIKYKLNIEKIKKDINENNYTNFYQYDAKTNFHGKHISKFNGTTDYKKILNKDELGILEKNIKLSKIIEKFYKEK